jgi:uncharacterized protein (TIGR03083 family)
MGMNRIAALQAERNEVVDFCKALSPEDWSRPSRCAGWTVQDVIAHMGAAYHGTFTPWVIKLMRTDALERNNDADAERRRDWPTEKVFREYEKWSKRFLAIQPLLQHGPGGAIPIRLGEMGTYPARLLASALTFDHYVHLRYDLATTLGRGVPQGDANRISVLLEWMLAGLPNMSGQALSWLPGSVELVLEGEGGGTWTVTPGSGGVVQVATGPMWASAARIVSPAESFPLWATKRQPWRESDLKIEGDQDVAERFLDSVVVV